MLQQNKGGRHTVAPKFPNFRVSTRRQGTSVDTLAEDKKKDEGEKDQKQKKTTTTKKEQQKYFFICHSKLYKKHTHHQQIFLTSYEQIFLK